MVSISAEEKTEVIQGTETIISKNVQDLYKIRRTFDICSDHLSTFGYVSFKPVWQGLCDLKRRNVYVMLITEITPQNLEYCKKLAAIAEVRHLDRVKGNFGIADGIDYRATAKIDDKKLAPIEAIQSTVRVFVEQQQYFFDTLWSKSVPAQQRIVEIEKGTVPDFIHTVMNSAEIGKIQYNLLKSAKQEILLMFPKSEMFYRHGEYARILSLLGDISVQNRSLQVGK